MSEGDRVDRSLDTEHDLGLRGVKDFFVRQHSAPELVVVAEQAWRYLVLCLEWVGCVV